MHKVRVWPLPERLFHWLGALAVMVIVPAGFVMSWTYLAMVKGGPLAPVHIRASQIHHTLGMLLLLATFARLWWRLRNRTPQIVNGQATPVARLVQAILYGLLFLLPLSGWAALSSLAGADGYPAPSMWFLNHDGFATGGHIPRLVSAKAWNDPGLLTYGTFARVHVYLLWLGALVLALHVGAALWHHLVRRDGTLLAMMGKRPG